jgi:SAM-dependent methyltransferase
MDPELRVRLEPHTGQPISSATPVRGGGYTPAGRWRLHLADGSTLFAKVGSSPLTAGWVRDEALWYSQLSGDFLPALRGFVDHPEHPVLLLEDLSHARWPPPWEPGDLQRLQGLLARLASADPLPSELPPLESRRETLSGWTEVARDPAPLLSLGLCSAPWLQDALPALLQAQSDVDLQGEALVHFDLRSDNLCFDGERVVLVDWNLPCRGSSTFDRAFLAPSCRLEGGPLPEELAPEPGWAALVSGFFASRAGLPSIPDAPRVRWIQRRQLAIALPWAARALGLPEPGWDWARAACSRADQALASGACSEAQWHARIEEALVDAYLSVADPRRMSGKTGDELEWRWSRELILDAVPAERCSVLDVGCANGYLLASLARWGAERGLQLDLFGLEISERLARLAQREHPQWAEQIFVGNVMSWVPPRRFDLVHTGLDYAPPGRQRELVLHILHELLVPGGRLVLRAERAGPDDPAAKLAQLGFVPDGIIEVAHPETATIRATAWLIAPRGVSPKKICRL